MGCRHPQGGGGLCCSSTRAENSHNFATNLASSSGALFLLLSHVIIAEVNKMLHHLESFCDYNSHYVFSQLKEPRSSTRGSQFSGAFSKLRKATITFVMSVRPSICLSVCPSGWNNSAPIGRIFMKFYI
jgi:hypothetical protein